MSAPAVSVVVPARDERGRIDTLFDALERLDTDGLAVEWLVVDHLSEDGTGDAAAARGATVVRAEGATVASARNAGVAQARGEIVAFLDADCLPPRDWLRVGTEMFREDGRLGACGARYVSPENASRLERVWEAAAARRTSSYLPTGGLLVRRRAFEAAGGFTEGLVTGEDADLSHKIRSAGWGVRSDPRLAVVHDGSPKDLRGLFRQQLWHAQGSRLRYAGTGVSPVHLFSLTWIPGTVLLGAAALGWRSVPAAVAALLWALAAPLAISAKRGILRLRSPADGLYLLAAATVYLAGRSAGRLVGAGRWR